MNRSAVVAWSLFAISLLAMAVALILWAVWAQEAFEPDIVLYPAAYLAFGAVGAVIVSRHPSNRVGQLALVAGAWGAVSGLADTWARLVLPLPAQDWAAWLATWGFPASLAPPVLLVLVFPTGRLTSRAWRIVAALVVLGCAIVAIGSALTPDMADHPGRDNPVGVDWFTGSALEGGGVGWLLFLVGTVVAALGLIPRLRRARGVEREQLKWITYAATLHGAAWVVLAFDPPTGAAELAQYAVFVTLALVPVAAGIAILRYRLYDIDVVIRRTLVYGALVGVLGAVYAGLVVGLQAVLSGVLGSETLPIAISTLATAALFGPARRRVREVVDRRFYRSRYDARRTAEAFGAQLRDEVELDAVAGILVAVAGQTLRPASIGLWLRRSGSS